MCQGQNNQFPVRTVSPYGPGTTCVWRTAFNDVPMVLGIMMAMMISTIAYTFCGHRR